MCGHHCCMTGDLLAFTANLLLITTYDMHGCIYLCILQLFGKPLADERLQQERQMHKIVRHMYICMYEYGKILRIL
jgi:hypothetical protein